MNRADRRRILQGLFRVRRRLVRSPSPAAVTLVGGPMHGWLVRPNAPCLRADWHRTFPPEWPRGRYVLDGRGSAVWQFEQPAGDVAGMGPGSRESGARPPTRSAA